MPERTIASMLEGLYKHDFVLPAIQREFVWNSSQICRLFDSLMRGYPIGTFLTWRVPPDQIQNHIFYDFIRDYHQKDNPHCPELKPAAGQPLIAVLDGQQRLTAINIGLRGSHAEKLPRLWWNNPAAYPTKNLYLDLKHKGSDSELGVQYDFRFLTPAEAASGAGKANAFWFKVGEMLDMKGISDLLNYLPKHQLGNDAEASGCLAKLHEVVHVEPLVHYYQDESGDIDKVLNIFIRVNSGGTVLSYSDLLLSLATAQWKTGDARKATHDLVDDLNKTGLGFDLSKDLVLKTGLMILDAGDIRFHIKNFDPNTMQRLETEWDHLGQVLRATVELLASFGYSRETLSARSVIIPIAYYLHTRNLGSEYVTKDGYAKDRAQVRQWVTRSLLKRGVWGSGLDQTLLGIRSVLKNEANQGWPVDALEGEMTRLGHTLNFQLGEVEDLLSIEYGDKRVFGLLALLYPGINTTQQFHIDHIFPKSRFTKAKLVEVGVDPSDVADYEDAANRVPNLQLLVGSANIVKQAALPADWLRTHFAEEEQRSEWKFRYDAADLPDGIIDVPDFFTSRRNLMRDRLVKALGVDTNKTETAEPPDDQVDEEAASL